MDTYIVDDRESYLEWLKEEYAKLEKLGSTIFPMKGNESFEALKMNIKRDMKNARKVIKAIEAEESRVEI